jgi:peptidoglycan hydrolase-like protein with peptidoglycan-binding domain
MQKRFLFVSMLSLFLVTLAVGSIAFATRQPAHAATTNVVLLQSDLAGLSYLPMSGIDGIYGPNTTDAVKHYQSDRSLQVDGDAGPITMNALESEVQSVQKTAGTTADGDYGPNTIAAVKTYQSAHHLEVDGIAGPQTMGAMNIQRIVAGNTTGANSVVLLQSDLAGLSYLPMSGIDGIYGPQTTNAVYTFQSENNLQCDGDAGPITMNALESKVKAVQKTAGTTADGDYGPNTIAAVKTYQSAHHLEVDGIAGPQTMKAMGITREVGGGSCGQPSGGSPKPPTLSGTTLDKIVEAAKSQIGVHEWGDNCNPYGPCESWCALFASWTWRQAGINFSTAFSGDFYTYGVNHGTLHSGLSNPQPGDAIVFGSGPQNVDTSVHVGIIVQVLSNGEVISIEGNYNNQVTQVGPYWPNDRSAYDGTPNAYAIVSPA